MKMKKYGSVILAIALIWGLFAIDSRVESQAYTVFMYIAWALILVLLLGYMIFLRISVWNKLTEKMDPAAYLKQAAALDGTKYTADRYMFESLAYLLEENYERSALALKDAYAGKLKNADRIKTDAVGVLVWYFKGDQRNLTDALGRLHHDFSAQSASQKKKFASFLRFAELVQSLAFEDETPDALAKAYFNEIEKKTLLEVYTAELLVGEVRQKAGNTESAKALFENVRQAAGDTVLGKRAAAYLDQMI